MIDSMMLPLDKKPVVLVIEDERPLLDAIKVKMEAGGFEVLTARSVSQALATLQAATQVNAIWLDHYLIGKESGLELLAQLKQPESTWKNIPVFVVSNTASNEKMHAYMQLGVNQYFVKSNYRLDQIIGAIVDELTH